MKRIFTLALAICMALSMMVLTASAAAPAGVNYDECKCTINDGYQHIYVTNPNFDNDHVKAIVYKKATHRVSINNIIPKNGFPPITSEGWYVSNNGSEFSPCTGVHGPQPVPQSQPKTGVMDTLPLWFGVMAVSACAYVLTSKKKVF